MASDDGRFVSGDILQDPSSLLSTVIQTVVQVEAPIHTGELSTRVAAILGTKAGSRVQARIQMVASQMLAAGVVRLRGEFFWGVNDRLEVRSRAGTKISADRIAPEEFEQAILAVLGGGHRMPRGVVTTEVRSVLGYSRTGAIIEDAVSAAVARLLASGVLGESSAGLALRG
jgi:hypothetical protein